MDPRRMRERSGAAGGRALAWATAAALAVSGAWVPARAQDEVANFRKPVLTVETDGHHAPVRSLLWRGSFTLVSGGLDKTVKVWDFRDGPRLAQSLRPVLWRGLAGGIYALALSPNPDANGQSLLAVAGFGVENKRADFTVFRVPGLGPAPTGEVVARVMPALNDQAVGHGNSVLCLAFDPSGRVLASGGKDFSVVVWDVVTPGNGFGGAVTIRPRVKLRQHQKEVRALAFLPTDGTKLVTASVDGGIRLWSLETNAVVSEYRGPAPILWNAMAVSPDGRTIVAGSELGKLYAFDTADLRNPRALPTRPEQGAVEALAFHRDGRRLAASIKSDQSNAINPRTMACDVEVRDFPAGNVLHTERVRGLVYACAFSPDGRQLAFSGGDAQEIHVKELDNLDGPPQLLKGQGSTPFDVGFSRKDPALVGFTREADPARAVSTTYDAFDLRRRRATVVPPGDLSRALSTFNGWSFRESFVDYQLSLVGPDGQLVRLALDPDKERLWWSYTFVPPNPGAGHPNPAVAVGCETGVVFFDLQGKRTRMFAGPASAVVSVAPSPDGHWLAAGSLDQTVMLCPLAGCDTRPGLGATYRPRADGSWVVESVTPGGFARAMGLKPGDLIVVARVTTGMGPNQVTEQFRATERVREFVKRADDLAPNDQFVIEVREATAPGAPAGPVRPLSSTKRDNPAMTLMLDTARQWVLWTPQGYYDTSIEGDTRLLGWHVNAPFDQPRPTDYFPVGAFAKTLHRPDVLERIYTTRRLDVAEAVPGAVAPPGNLPADESPPEITFVSADPRLAADPQGVWTSSVPAPRVRVRVRALGASKLGGVQFFLGERLLQPRQALGPVAEYVEDVALDLPVDRRVRLVVKATNAQGRDREASIDLVHRTPKPAPTPPAPPSRLIVLGLGTDRFPGGGLPDVPFAEGDAQELAGFLAEHLVAADGRRPAPVAAADRTVLLGPAATVQSVHAALGQLEDRLRRKELKRGDLIAVAIASHVLDFGRAELPRIALAATRLTDPEGTTVSARDLSELFGQLTDYGCRVVLFVDGVHRGEVPAPAPVRSEIKTWVRDLQKTRGVITVAASIDGPSDTFLGRDRGQGYFTAGVKNVFKSAARADGTAELTLDQFRGAVVQEVLSLSNREQQAGVFRPLGVPPYTPFVHP